MNRKEAPGWINAVPPVGMMASFTGMAIGAIHDHRWYAVAACIIGICCAAATWYLIGLLREEIAAHKRQAVRDAYEISGLQADLRRARSWQN